jgi:hypothetical protein
MKTWKKRLATIGLIVLLVGAVAWVGILEKNDQFMSGKWTFENDVQLEKNLDIDLTLTVDGASTFTGDVAATGAITVTNEFVHGKYSEAELAGGALFATGADIDVDPDDGDVFLFAGTTTLTLSMPSLTAALDGWVFSIVNRAGTGLTISTQLADALYRGGALGLATVGSFGLTGSTIAWIDSIGDSITLVGDYDSGTSPTWWILSAVTQ